MVPNVYAHFSFVISLTKSHATSGCFDDFEMPNPWELGVA